MFLIDFSRKETSIIYQRMRLIIRRLLKLTFFKSGHSSDWLPIGNNVYKMITHFYFRIYQEGLSSDTDNPQAAAIFF